MTEVETATMSERGQVIIPKDIRDYIGATANTLFVVMPLDKQTIIMKKLDREKLVAEFRQMRESIAEKMTEEEIREEISRYRQEKKQQK